MNDVPFGQRIPQLLKFNSIGCQLLPKKKEKKKGITENDIEYWNQLKMPRLDKHLEASITIFFIVDVISGEIY